MVANQQSREREDVVAYLLQQSAVQATVDAVSVDNMTALCNASAWGHDAHVRLLLDAGADPTIPAGEHSPLGHSVRKGNPRISALLRHAIAADDFTRALYKARCLLDAAIVIAKAAQNARDKGEPPAVQRQRAMAAAPPYLKGRVEQEQPLPVVELKPMRKKPRQWEEKARATIASVLGMTEGGVMYPGLPEEVYEQLMEYMVLGWMDKGPNQA